jgi:radical SAM protein with 4Fe4S-binding SPASM domain
MYSPLRFLPSVFIKKAPLHLTLFVTRRCNARCPFCFYLEKNENHAESSELSLDEIKRISGSMKNLLWVAFSGGEVFLRKEIIEISRAFYKNNRPSIMLYSTNGLMPDTIIERTEQILKSCPNSVITVKVSIDGIGEKHDSLRGVPNSFNKVIETCKLLSELLDKYRNFELGINTVFCSSNQDDMDEIMEFVGGLDMINTHTVSLVRGDIKETAYKDIDIDKYLETIEKLEKNLKEGSSPIYRFRGSRIKAAQDVLQRSLIHRTFKEKRQLLPCYAGMLNMVISETGEVYPCENFKDDFNIGNVRAFNCDIISLLNSKRAKGIISSIKKGCFCTHECYMMTNILFNPRMYPNLLRETLQIGKHRP